MSEHALLSPSSMDRILGCAASLAQSDGEPNNGNKYAWEGTAAHTLASDCLTQALPALAFLGRIIEVVEDGKKVAEFEVDEEMAGNVQMYLDYVNGVVEANGSELYVEQKVDFSEVVAYPDSTGTSDTIMLHPMSDMPVAFELHIVDLKYGRGVRVDAEDNAQMMTYALGALVMFEHSHDIASVRMTISQPRLNHVSEWMISPSVLKNWGEYTLKKGCANALALLKFRQDNTPIPPILYTPTPDNCKFCKGKATCPAVRNMVKEAVQVIEFEDLDEKANIAVPDNDAFLDEVFPKLDLIYDWLGAVRAKVEARLFDGAEFANAKLIQGRRGNRKWKDEKQAEADMKSMRLKVEEMYKFSLITVAQAEKVLKDKPKCLKRMLAQVEQADGKIGVALMSDPAPAYIPPQPEFDNLDAVDTDSAEDLA